MGCRLSAVIQADPLRQAPEVKTPLKRKACLNGAPAEQLSVAGCQPSAIRVWAVGCRPSAVGCHSSRSPPTSSRSKNPTQAKSVLEWGTRRTVVGCRLSVVSCQPSAIRVWAVGCRPSAVIQADPLRQAPEVKTPLKRKACLSGAPAEQLSSVVGCQLSQLSAISHQRSAIRTADPPLRLAPVGMTERLPVIGFSTLSCQPSAISCP